MDKSRVAGGNGAGSKGVLIGGPRVVNATTDVVNGPLGGKFSHASFELETRTSPYHQAAGR